MPYFVVTAAASGVSFDCNVAARSIFASLERSKDLDTNFRHDTSDRENSTRRARPQRVEQHSSIPRHHRKVTRTKLNCPTEIPQRRSNCLSRR